MITITNKEECCGCNACSQVCPVNCIEMKPDSQGFLYPVTNIEKCIDCNICNKTCPIINTSRHTTPIVSFAAKSSNKETQKHSSSGGIFSELAQLIIQDNGIVFGAKLDESYNVVHTYAEDFEQLHSFMGSKYVQSDINDSFIKAKKFLIEGRTVLFSGTPCHIAGLKHFLKKEYDNLITVEVICHGVPSPMVWQDYIKSLKLKKDCKYKISFRDKSNDWNNFALSIKETSERVVLHEIFKQNIYLKTFLKDLTLRQSCFDCKFKYQHSYSDIILGDYWDIEKHEPTFVDNNGVSAVIINSSKGEQIFKRASVLTHSTDINKISSGNPALYKNPVIPSTYSKFWQNYQKYGIDYIPTHLKEITPTITQRIVKKLRRIIYKQHN